MDETPQHNPLLAALLILAASVFIAFTTLLAKGLGTGFLGSMPLGEPLHPLQISHGRFLFAFVAVSSVAWSFRLRPRAVNWKLHIGRTTLGWMGVTLMFASVAFIPMADATAISFLNPVFCMVFAIPLLGEKVGRIRWGAAIIAFVGALILLRPSAQSFQPAALLALTAALIMGMELILIKLLTGRERPLQILLINNTLGLMLATVAVSFVWAAPTLAQWVALVGIGFAMAAAQVCFLNGMARADASFVAPFSYATLIFAALYDAAMFGTRPDLVSYIGAAIILTGALILALREAKLRD